MADQNLLDRESTGVSNSTDQVHIVRNNQDFRMDVGLIQGAAAAELITGNAVLNGGISYSGTGLIYDGTCSKFIIDSSVYNVLVTGAKTLSDGDSSFDRFDIIVVEVDLDTRPETFSLEVVEGTPSANPLFPSLDLTRQVQLGVVEVKQNATTDTTTTVNKIYDENIEWSNTELTDGGNLNENTDPYIGSKNFKTPATDKDVVSWTDSGLTTFNKENSLILALRFSPTALSKISIKLINTSSSKYWLKTLKEGDFSGNGSRGGWLLFNIGLFDFQPNSSTTTQYDRIEFTFLDTPELELDRIELQGNLQQSPGGIRQRDLIDTPNSYVGKAGQVQIMNVDENEWEFTNTVNTELESGMSGEDLVFNILSLTQAEYDAGTPIATTFYIITN